jgi:hypothetical protein
MTEYCAVYVNRLPRQLLRGMALSDLRVNPTTQVWTFIIKATAV